MTKDLVYQHIVETGAPLKFSAPWIHLAADPDFFRVADPGALFEGLRTKFAADVLIDSGAALVNAGGTPALNPKLSSPKTILWAVRTRPAAAPSQLIADLRCLDKRSWSFAAALLDHRSAPMIERADDRVAVAFSMEDLAIQRSLKIPAVPSAGLQRLTGAGLNSFCKYVHLERDADGGDAESLVKVAERRPRLLTLLNWSIARLEPIPPACADELWRYWLKLYQHLGLKIEEYKRIDPTEAELAKLRFLAEHHAWEQIRETIFDGNYRHERSIFGDSLPERHVPGALPEALQKWRKLFNTKLIDGTARTTAWNDLRAIYERNHIDHLLERAAETTDSTERSMLLTLADLNRMIQPQIVQLTEKAGKAVAEKGADANVFSAEEFQQVMSGIDRILALQQGIQACRAKKSFLMIRPPRPKASTAGSKRSASPRKSLPLFGGKGSLPPKPEGAA